MADVHLTNVADLGGSPSIDEGMGVLCKISVRIACPLRGFHAMCDLEISPSKARINLMSVHRPL